MNDDQNTYLQSDADASIKDAGNHGDTGLKEDQSKAGFENNSNPRAYNIFMGSLLHDQDDVSFEHNVNYDNHSELIDEKEDSIIEDSAAPSNYLQSIMTNVSNVQKK